MSDFTGISSAWGLLPCTDGNGASRHSPDSCLYGEVSLPCRLPRAVTPERWRWRRHGLCLVDPPASYDRQALGESFFEFAVLHAAMKDRRDKIIENAGQKAATFSNYES